MGPLGVCVFKAPTVVGRLKSKLKDVNVDSSMVLRTVLELSSLWVGLESLVSQISVPGTRTASWSMWAELTYNCGVCLDGTGLSFLLLTLPIVFSSGFCFLHSLQWKTATTRNLRSGHFGIPVVDKAKGSGCSGLPKETFFQ